MADITNAPKGETAAAQGVYYIPDDILYKHPQLFSVLNGKTISLTGKSETVTKKANEDRPARTVVYAAATQADFKKLFEAGHPFVKKRDV